MNSQRPYFPFDTVDVPANVNYASLSEEGICDWNLKLTVEGSCHVTAPFDPSLITLWTYAEFQPTSYERSVESEEDGYGNQFNEMTIIKPKFGFRIWADEYIKKYVFQMLYGAKEIRLTYKDASFFIAKNIAIEETTLANGVYALDVTYESADDAEHGIFGLTGCCISAYDEAPYESECDPGDLGGGAPGCEGIDFVVSRSGDTLTGTATGATGTTSISWYYRASAASAWILLISGANSVSVGGFGYYRAILTVAGCGQFVDQYLYSNPCDGFNVRIRRNASNGIVAEMDTPISGVSYAWEKNTGTGWTSLPDTSAAILVDITADYRVTVTKDDCTDSDIMYVEVAECALVASLSYVDDELGVLISNCSGSPEYNWSVDYGAGLVPFDTGGPAYGSSIFPDATGLYVCEVTCDGCTVTAQKVIIIAGDPCPFIVSIDRSGSVLSANTSASSPTYQWKKETEDGIVNLGTAVTQETTGGGRYILEVTSGACTKESYIMVNEATKYKLVMTRQNGSVFNVFGLDWGSTPGTTWKVLVNSTEQTYSPSAPAAANIWSVNASDQLVLFGTLTNATITIETA